MKPLDIDGAWLYEPEVHSDGRGSFTETFRGDEFERDLGYRLDVMQVNRSVSLKGVIRGVHFAEVPPGQAKFVTCLQGEILDVITDIRMGSPTFGYSQAVRLTGEDCKAVYLSAGLGHSYQALADCVVSYLCSAVHNPEREHGVNPLDSALDIPWEDTGDLHLLSGKDAKAPTLGEMILSGLLPKYSDCKGLQ